MRHPHAVTDPLRRSFVLAFLLAALLRMLFLEEEEEAGGLVGSYRGSRKALPRELLESEQEYLTLVDELISAYSENGKRRLRRYHGMAILSLGAASAVPVAVAAGAAGWLVASLGGLAAISQGTQQVLQDQRLGVESHAIAVRLGRAVRALRVELQSPSGHRDEKAFPAFVSTVEEVLDSGGEAMIAIMRQERPLAGGPDQK